MINPNTIKTEVPGSSPGWPTSLGKLERLGKSGGVPVLSSDACPYMN
jgi:hypothetical protein